MGKVKPGSGAFAFAGFSPGPDDPGSPPGQTTPPERPRLAGRAGRVASYRLGVLVPAARLPRVPPFGARAPPPGTPLAWPGCRPARPRRRPFAWAAIEI
jgi:hypothetical protein